MPSVTVILPVYNAVRFVRAALESALTQTMPPLEIIAVDDGSRDDSAAICASYGPPVRVVTQPNAGVAAARNRGAHLGSGDWVAFLDADDVWQPEKLEYQLEAAAATDVAWLCTNCGIIDTAGRKLPRRAIESVCPAFGVAGRGVGGFFELAVHPDEVAVGSRAIPCYAGDLYGLCFYGNFVLPSSALVRRDVFLRSGGFDTTLRYAEETEYFHRLAAHHPGCFVDAPLTTYRLGDSTNLTAGRNTAVLIRNALRSADRAAAIRPPNTPLELAARRIGRRHLSLKLARTYLTDLDPREARKALAVLARQDRRAVLRAVPLFLLTFLPGVILRFGRRLRRRLRRTPTTDPVVSTAVQAPRDTAS